MIRALPLAILLAASAAQAETRRDFQVSAAIVAGCAVALDAGGRWGRIDLGTVAGTDTGAVEAEILAAAGAGLRLDCTPGVTARVTADAGEHGVGGARRLAHGSGATVPYELFADGSATPWRDGAIPVSFAAGVHRRTLPIRARAALTGALPAGRYADTVRVTLTW